MAKIASAELDSHIESIANDLRPLVDDIESSVATTKNHYGQYMAMLTMAGNDPQSIAIICAALLSAGANHAGVASAYKIVKG